MRTFLLATLLLPCLALGQVPARPPGIRPRPVPVPGGGMRPASDLEVQPAPPGAPPPPRPLTPPAPGAAPGAPPPAAGGPRGTAETTVPSRDKCQPLQGRFMLTFNKADVVDVLEQASRWTCRNFIYTEDVARGKITLLSKTPVTADEAYAAFLAALTSNNIAVYPSGKYYKLIRIADAKKQPIPTYVGDESGTPGNEQPITKVIRLSYADADQLRGIMGNFISPQGADIQSIPPDTLIITDVGLNIRRIERLVEAIDRPGGGDIVRIVQVRYAPVKDMADKVNQIFGSQAGGAPGRPGARRSMIRSAPTPAGSAPGAPGAAAAAGTPGGRTEEISVSKVIPDERTNKLIVIADERSFQRIVDLVEQLDLPAAGEGGIHVVFLRNANAEQLAQTLGSLAQAKRQGQGNAAGAPAVPGAVPAALTPASAAAAGPATAEVLSGEVKVTADKTQNALIIQASGGDFAAMQRLIDKLDRPRRQVFVEAVIMEVNLSDSTQFGVGMHRLLPVSYKGDTGILPIASEPGTPSSFSVSSVASLGGFLSGFVGPTSATLSALGINIPSIGILVQALQSNSDVNVISTPHILASDNEESEITVGQNVPFQAGYAPQGLSNLVGTSTTGTGTATALGTTLGLGGLNSLYAPIQRQNVELRLKIKPQISEGDTIRLAVEEQTEEIASTDPVLGPTTAKRSVKTNIVVRDQGTIVLGGLIQERSVRSVKKVPILGSLPIVGWLFRSTNTTKTKTNLLMFLTPYVIRDEHDYRRIYEKKRSEQQTFQEQFYGKQPGYQVDIDFARKAGPYAMIRRDVRNESQRLENGGPGLPSERVITPRGGAAPAPVPPAGPPVAPDARRPRDVTEGEGTAVDRLDVQPEVPAPGTAPPPPAPPAGGATAPPEAQPPAPPAPQPE